MIPTEHTTEKTIHQRRSVKRFRDMLGWNQEALAIEFGADWSQKKVSRLEEQDVIEEDLLAEIARFRSLIFGRVCEMQQ